MLGLAKDGKSYQEIEAVVNSLFPEEGLTTVVVLLVRKYPFHF
jgi:hypothetical protein